MIISGGSRSNWQFFARHLTRADQNERVTVAEIRGLAAEDVRGALREMDMMGSAGRCKNRFYHADLNPRADERLTPEQWEQAVDTLERELKLDGHSRLVVEHEKAGRTHRHVVWSRIDADTMTAVSDSNNYAAHERAARELEREFGHEAVRGVHAGRDGNPRPKRREKNWEVFRGHESAIDPREVKAELTALWHECDSGQAFKAALEERGFILAKGDRRDFCIIDPAGDEHSLARRIDGAKAADIRARMADIDRDDLPSVAEARETARADATTGDAPPTGATPEPVIQPMEAALPATDPPPHRPPTALDIFARDMADAMREEMDNPGEGYGDGLTWWERAVEHVIDIAEDVMELAGEVTEWAKDHWQSFTERLHSERERKAEEPDMER